MTGDGEVKRYRLVRAALIAALIQIAAMLSLAPARADVISHSVMFSNLSEVRGNNPTLDFQAAIPFFDTALGTLKQVDIRYNFDLSLVISIANRTVNPLSVPLAANSLQIEATRFFDTMRSGLNVTSLPPTTGLVAATNFGNSTIEVAAGTPRQIGSINLVLPGHGSEQVDVDSTRAMTSRPSSITLSSGRVIVLRSQGNVAPFVGSGEKVLDFKAMTLASLNLPNSGNIFNGISSSTSFELGGSVEVTYDYEAAVAPVPLPAALPMVLGGFAVLGLVGWRKKKRSGKV